MQVCTPEENTDASARVDNNGNPLGKPANYNARDSHENTYIKTIL